MTDRVMVDIETLGLEPGAAILSIGAVRFDAGQLGETFYAEVSLESCQDAGLTIDAGTLEWWLSQESDAQAVITGGESLGKVLPRFKSWYGDADEIWANSPSFDCEHLERAFAAVDMTEPWTFGEERDYRTLASLSVAPDIEHEGTAHDALDDAEHQAHVAAAALKRLTATDWECDT